MKVSLLILGLLEIGGIQARGHKKTHKKKNAVAASSSCVSIKTTSVCSPWSAVPAGSDKEVKVDLGKLAQVYGLKKGSNFTVQQWETLLISITSGGKAQKEYWNNYTACSGYSGEQLQYFRSYACLSDLFVVSAKCNKQITHLTPVCPEVCDNFGGAVKGLLENKESCPALSKPSTEDEEDFDLDDLDDKPAAASALSAKEIEKIQKRRALALKVGQSCKKLIKKPFFNQKEQCVVGVKVDQDSCGFGGNVNVSKTYCAKNSKATCCSSLASNITTSATAQNYEDSLLGTFQRLTMMWGVGPVSSSSAPSKPFTQTIAFYIIIGAAALVVLGAAACICIRRRRARVAATGFVLLKDGASVPLVESGFSGQSGKLRCIVKYDYSPNLSDEIELKVGDIIIFESLSDDGWGDARNETTGAVGKACTRFCEKA